MATGDARHRHDYVRDFSSNTDMRNGPFQPTTAAARSGVADARISLHRVIAVGCGGGNYSAAGTAPCADTCQHF
jgi:hypothetical protein